MQLHDSNGIRRYMVKDFYDDSLMRELDEGEFLMVFMIRTGFENTSA